jgi:TetR/AcrR family transcriptional regulator, tetracycline repressor protein
VLRERPIWRPNKARKARIDQIAIHGARDRVDARNQRPRTRAAIVAPGRERAHDGMKAGCDEIDELIAFFGFRIGELAVLRDVVRFSQNCGLHAISLTKLNGWLHYSLSLLYWHVKDKQELLDEMGTEIWRRVSQEMLALGSDLAWRERLPAYATIVRRALLSHRDGAKAFSGTYMTDVGVLQQQESMFAQMADAGFTLSDTVRAYSLLYSFTVGFCIEEQAVASAEPGDDRYSLARRAARLQADRYPLVVESGSYIFGDPDARFADLVEVIVGSIERMQTN